MCADPRATVLREDLTFIVALLSIIKGLDSRPAQIFFGTKAQTPQGNLGPKVSALQF